MRRLPFTCKSRPYVSTWTGQTRMTHHTWILSHHLFQTIWPYSPLFTHDPSLVIPHLPALFIQSIVYPVLIHWLTFYSRTVKGWWNLQKLCSKNWLLTCRSGQVSFEHYSNRFYAYIRVLNINSSTQATLSSRNKWNRKYIRLKDEA